MGSSNTSFVLINIIFINYFINGIYETLFFKYANDKYDKYAYFIRNNKSTLLPILQSTIYCVSRYIIGVLAIA